MCILKAKVAWHAYALQVQCDDCDCWQHLDCVDMNETLKKHIEDDEKPFLCLTCANYAPAFAY